MIIPGNIVLLRIKYILKETKRGYSSEYHTSYVIDDKTIFFYAGLIDIDRLDRKYYKIKFEFTEEKIDLQTRKLKISSDNEDINLVVKGQPSYTVEEEMDATRPLPKTYLRNNQQSGI